MLLSVATVAALYSGSLHAVDCTPGDITLTTQAEVDSFQADHGGGGVCDRVSGDLRIVNSEDIVNLNGLSGLITVNGDLIMHGVELLESLEGLNALKTVREDLQIYDNDSLKSFAGLEALENVWEDLRIRDNPELTNIDALSALNRVGDWLTIDSNPKLANIDGLSSLTIVGEILSIISNDALTNVDGLQALDSIDKRLRIDDNDALTSLEGLSNIEIVRGELRILNNGALEDLTGLRKVVTVGDQLLIENNDSMTGINGMTLLKRIGGDFIVRDNSSLRDFDGLKGMTEVGSLTISNNRRLKDLDGIQDLISVQDDVEISENRVLADCASLELLLDSIDHAEPGPGPGPSGVPDVGDVVLMSGNDDGCNSVDEILAEFPLTEMNRGLTDAWFEPETSGQGFLISVFEDVGLVFLAWFTYDAERPPADVTAVLGEPGHRWLTAQGEYDGNEATLDVWISEGGVFDSELPAPALRKDGEMTLKFTNCNSGDLIYDIPSANRHGRVFLERVVLDNVSLCHALENAD